MGSYGRGVAIVAGGCGAVAIVVAGRGGGRIIRGAGTLQSSENFRSTPFLPKLLERESRGFRNKQEIQEQSGFRNKVDSGRKEAVGLGAPSPRLTRGGGSGGKGGGEGNHRLYEIRKLLSRIRGS